MSLGKTVDGKLETFADVSDIKVAGNIRRVWLKGVVSPHTEKGPASDSGKWVAYRINRLAFNCDDEEYRMDANIIYYDDGTNFTASPGSLSALWESVPPDTALHVAMAFTCSWKPTTQTGAPPSQNGDPHLSEVDRSTPAQGVRTIQMPDCGTDYYPSQALRQGHHGAVVVRVCIGINNMVDGPVELIKSSGFPSLDEAAGRCLAAGRYMAGIVNGAPARMCKDFKVTFSRDQ